MVSSDLIILKILKILQEKSDEDHPLTYLEIGDILEKEYKITLERKAIGRKIDALIEEGYDIVKGRGCYLNRREFTNPEIRILTNLVASSKYISEEKSEELINKISSFGGPSFREKMKPNYVWDKTENKNIFDNLEKISYAIEKGKMITYIRKKFSFENENDKTFFKGTPIDIYIKKDRYYFRFIPERMLKEDASTINLEWVYDVEVLDEDISSPDIDFIEAIEQNENILVKNKKTKKDNVGREITYICEFVFASEIEENFGVDVKIVPLSKDEKNRLNYPCKVSLYTTSREAIDFAIENLDNCFLMEPKDLSLDIYEKIIASKNFYNVMNKITEKEK